MIERKHRRGNFMAALGAALMLLGACVVLLAGDTLQFVFAAPPAGEGGALVAVYESGMEALNGMADTLPARAMAARLQGTTVSSGQGKSAGVTLYAVGEGYFDVMHETLREGRFISGTDVARAENVIVIEEKHAIQLFPGVDPIGQQVTLEGKSYEVAGVIAGGRRIGEADEGVVYIPITSADQNGLQMHTVACVAKGMDYLGSAILMEDTLRVWQTQGSFYNLQKMRMGALMPLRWALLIAGMCVLLTALQRICAFTMGRVCSIYEQLKTRYARDMALRIAGSALGALAMFALWLAAVRALAGFAVEPLYVFTEWVPEVVVELSSLQSRFWALNNANAAAVRCITREVAVYELGEGLLQWGLLALLLGLALRGVGFINREASMPQINSKR